MPWYSTKDVGWSVKPLFLYWLGALPRHGTMLLCGVTGNTTVFGAVISRSNRGGAASIKYFPMQKENFII